MRVPSILNVAKPWILGKKDFVNPDFGNEGFDKVIWQRGFIKMDFALREPLKGFRNLPGFFLVPGSPSLHFRAEPTNLISHLDTAYCNSFVPPADIVWER